MYLATLHLCHFRNYSDLLLEFSAGLNVVHGENAQGKTNLLEAIYFLATGRSPRAGRDQELIQHGAEELRARARVVRQTGALDLEIAYGQETRKALKINGVPERRIANLVGKLAAVFFSPDDLQLVKGPPAGRRRFLDIELSQVSSTYLHHLAVYNRVLAQRNTLLRQIAEGHVSPLLLEAFDDKLLDSGSQLIIRRLRAVESLAKLAAHYHAQMTGGVEQLSLSYVNSSIPDGVTAESEVRDRLVDALKRHRSEELRRAQTVVGPHRDDLLLRVNGQEARLFASQGQQRTAVLALKLAELEYMREQIGESPVLLLDDVASELDPNRRHFLLHAVDEGVQTFVSCTDLEDLMVRAWPANRRLLHVKAGVVTAQ